MVTSSKLNVEGSAGYAIHAVYGQMSTVGGHAKLNEVMGTFGIPGMREGTCCDIEDDYKSGGSGNNSSR